jgi:hypothetical protein
VFLALWAAALSAPAGAEYRFDDVYGPSGKGAQWMAVTTNDNTAGAPTTRKVNTVPIPAPMDAEADLPTGRNPVYLTNGGAAHEPINTLFLVLPDNPDPLIPDGTLWVSFDRVPADLNTQDVYVDNDVYVYYPVEKTSLGTKGTDQLYRLDFTKRRNAGVYESVRGNFIFHQNPNDAPSQTLQVPFIIANVYNGTAEGEPLRFRTSIRDAGGGSASGNIVAHDRFTWNVVADKNVDVGTDWVFVPLQKLPPDSNNVNYRMTTEVVNYSGIRYGLQRYDGYAQYDIYPRFWAFDVPTTGAATADVLRSFYLDDLSHIPPGLVTTYNHSFNVVSGVREMMHLYPIDPARGFRTLTIAHRSVFGLNLGTFSDPSVSPPSYVVTGFDFLSASAGVDFLEKMSRAFGVSNIKMPGESDGVMPNAVSYERIGGDVIASMKVSASVPGRIRGSDGRGLLPLHITFNLRRSNQLVYPHWDALRDQWRQTGNIENLFTEFFSLYLQDSHGNNLDLIKDRLDKEGAYQETVKVFLDEQREVVTVHFIAFLLDGPNSSVKLVKDETGTTDNTHIVVMDGNDNGKWEMTFFVAPAGYVKTDGRAEESGSGGGGGCGVGFGALALLACAFAVLKWRRKG